MELVGLGLPEALTQRYGRSDLQIVRWPDKNILERPPKNSYVLKFDYKNSKMELTRAP